MALKSIDYESRYINLEALDQKKPEYKELNPMGMVPTLIIDGKAVNDSIAIIELLEVLFVLWLCYEIPFRNYILRLDYCPKILLSAQR